MYQVSYLHNQMQGEIRKLQDEYKAKFNDDFYTGAVFHVFSALSNAMAKAKSTDPVKVAAALEGLRFKSFNGEVEARKTDHQLQQGLFISVWQKAGNTPVTNYNVENTGFQFAPVKAYDAYVSSTPTSCQMKRP
jgi:branched-chain amino acid transport system substrate-binding protein